MDLWWWQYLFCLGLLYFCVAEIHASSLRPSCSDHDRSALLHFKQSFQVDCAAFDPSSYPKTKTWRVGPNSDCCLWDGIECDIESGNVIELDLSNSCLYGSFPQNTTLFRLTHLRKLNLAFNYFNYSQIPSEIGQLRNLQSLDLSSAAFSGQIPSEIAKLSKITVLDLSTGDNGLKLRNPSLDFLIQNLTHLRELHLNNVDISSTLPNILTNLTSLEAIAFENSNLYGDVPTSLFRLPHLKILSFTYNSHLAGVLPKFQLNSPLETLGLLGTAFFGEVPHSIGNLTNLNILNLGYCQFSGSIPPSIGHLTSLTLLVMNDNNFVGDIPLSIANLTNLKALGLSSLNAMSPQLRLQFSKLYRLTKLRLIDIEVNSEVPSFLANLTGLTDLELINTRLKGQLPQWIANLTQIQELHLDMNQLEGPIPHGISQLTMLYYLDLSNNNLSGNFDIFFSLQSLRALGLSGLDIIFPAYTRKNTSVLQLQLLDLSDCNLTEFPLFLQHQTELQILLLEGNSIKGIIPQWLINTTKENLLETDLSGNKLTGFEQPLSALPWSNLESIYIDNNEWQGPLPTPPSSLQGYSASGNVLTGNIPIGLCNARSLSSLDLSNNSMSGHIPSCIGDQLGESLQLLNLRGNNLSGTISLKFTKLCTLEMINLSENTLEGNVPRSLSNCTKLQILDIGKNCLSDTFPSWLGSQLELQALVLRHNKFHGSIDDPKAGYDFPFLRIIDMSYNLFIGHLPDAYLRKWHKMRVSKEDNSDSSIIISTITIELHSGAVPLMGSMDQTILDYSITITNKRSETLYTKILTVFRVIDFSSNNFTGKIPNVIGELKGLQALNLSNNNLDGEIPLSLAKMIDLESLDLSLNNLSGELPQELSQLQSLEVFDVSYNHLTGQIPQGKQFNTFDNSSYEGNLALCGAPLSNSCNNSDATPSRLPSVASDSSIEDSKWIDWVIRSFGCVSGFFIGFVIGKLYITDKYHDWFMEMFQRRPKKRKARAPRRRR